MNFNQILHAPGEILFAALVSISHWQRQLGFAYHLIGHLVKANHWKGWLVRLSVQNGLGAVNYHTGETVTIIRKRKRRKEVAELLQALVDKHQTETIYVAWDNAITHQDDEVEAVVRAAAGRLVLLYLPTYSPWLNPIEMLWRHFRREVTHCELFETVKVLIDASYDFFNRFNRTPEKVLSIIGAHSI